MLQLDGWELILLAASGFVAVATLVRLMRRRRDALVDQLVDEIEREKRKRKTGNRKAARPNGPNRQTQRDAV